MRFAGWLAAIVFAVAAGALALTLALEKPETVKVTKKVTVHLRGDSSSSKLQDVFGQVAPIEVQPASMPKGPATCSFYANGTPEKATWYAQVCTLDKAPKKGHRLGVPLES